MRPQLEENSRYTNQSLLERVKLSDPKACDDFFRIYWPMLLRKARTLGIGENDAEDLAQEAMIRITNGLSTFKHKPGVVGGFRAWLNRIISCRVIDHRRYCEPRAAVWAKIDESSRSLSERVPAPPYSQPDAVLETEIQMALWELAQKLALRKADPKHVQIYEYLVEQDLAAKQVAMELHLSIPCVYMALSRIRRSIRKHYQHLSAERQNLMR